MDPALHLERYLGFMRSPVYVPENDLVAVTPEGEVASFMVWWPDQSGIAQIEPFGTHPRFSRRGVGRALIHHGLGLMRAAGMSICRVVTDDYRPATAFYESVGFDDVGALRWWAR
jgi:ribosomal protein S18 acetylase RimI-like enzyme